MIPSDKEIKNTYSTEEQVIGKWINEKPLYRKVYFINSISWSDNVYFIPSNINNIEYIINMKGICVNSTNGNFLPLPYAHPSQVTYQINMEYVKATDNIAIGSSGAYPNGRLTNCSIILEYTKTTD